MAHFRDARSFSRRKVVVGAICILVLGLAGTVLGITLTKGSSASAAGSRANRFASLRSCLQKQGITLPAFGGRPYGGSGSSPGSGEGSPSDRRPGFQLPEGVSAGQLRAAMEKCGAGSFPRGARPGYEGGSPRAGAPYGAPNEEPSSSAGEGSSTGAAGSEPSSSSS